MNVNFLQEISFLKHLERDELYRLFHDLQHEVLYPQWQAHLKSLVGEDFTALELYGPRSPIQPANYSSEIFEIISNTKDRDTLVLNHVCGFITDPFKLFKLVRNSGFKKIIVHEVPNDKDMTYEFYPIDLVLHKQMPIRQNLHNFSFNEITRLAVSSDWTLYSDTRLDFIYETEHQKMSITKLELGLDLIEHYYNGKLSRFNELSVELENWYFRTDSKLTAKGYSRWLLFK